MILTIVQIIFIVLILLSIYKRDISIFLFIVFLPLNTILPSSYNLFGYISYTNILFSIAFYHLLVWKDRQFPLTQFRKIAIIISVIFLSYLVYSDIRHDILGILPMYKDYNGYVDSLRELLRWGPVMLLIFKIDREYFEKVIFKGILLAVIILVFSGAFAVPLSALGFKIEYLAEFEYSEYRQHIDMPIFMRNSGFVSGGDFNVLGATYNMIIAFILCYFNFKKILNTPSIILCLIFSVIGVILTGSRMAFITLFLTVILFSLQTRSIEKITKYLAFFIIVIGVIYMFGMLDFILERLKFQNTLSEISFSTRASRANRWLSYLTYSTSRINRFLFGYDSVHYFIGHQFVDSHNLYLRMLYYGGFSFVLLLLIQIYRLIRIMLSGKLQFPLLTILFPCFISTMIISQHTWIYYLLLIISINNFEDE